MAVQIQLRRGTASAWTSANPTLAIGEFAVETDTDKYKIGDGSTAWTSLSYSSLPSGAVTTAGGVTITGTMTHGADGTGADVRWNSGTAGDYMLWDASEEQLVITGTSGATALNVADGNVVIAGDLTVNGTSINLSTTNTVVEDALIELNNGASSNANDLGIVMERGSTGDNAIIAWDESADKFTMGTTTATGSSSGNLTITAGTLVVNLEGNVTGDVTGNTSGTSGSTTGNAATATALATARTIGGTSFDGTAAIVPGTITVADTTDTSCNVALFESATGDLAPKSDAGLTYNAGTGTLSAVTSLGGFSGPSILNIPTNEGSNFTLAADDAGAFVRINNASNNTVTVPPNSAVDFPIGTQIILCTLHTGETTITPGSGVELYSVGSGTANAGDLKIDGRYATAALVQTLTDQWHVFGKLTS
jgi:hypothetical protein